MKRMTALICILSIFSGIFAGVQDTDELWKKFQDIKKKNRDWKPGLVTTKQVTSNKKGEVMNDLEVVIEYKQTEHGLESEFVRGSSDGVPLEKDDPVVEQFLTKFSDSDEDDDSDDSISDRKDLSLERTGEKRGISGFTCIGYDFEYEDMIDMSKDKSGSKMKKAKMKGTFWLDEISGAMIMQESTFAKAPSRMIKSMKNTILFEYNENGDWRPLEVNIDMKISVMFMTAISNTRMTLSDHFKKKNL